MAQISCPMTLSKGIGKLEESSCDFDNSIQKWNILDEDLSL